MGVGKKKRRAVGVVRVNELESAESAHGLKVKEDEWRRKGKWKENEICRMPELDFGGESQMVGFN